MTAISKRKGLTNAEALVRQTGSICNDPCRQIRNRAQPSFGGDSARAHSIGGGHRRRRQYPDTVLCGSVLSGCCLSWLGGVSACCSCSSGVCWVRCPRSPYCGWCWSAKLHGSLTPFAKNSRLSGPMAPLGFQFCMHKGWGSTEIICKCVGSPTAFNRKHCPRRPGRRGRCNPQSTTTSTFPESS